MIQGAPTSTSSNNYYIWGKAGSVNKILEVVTKY
jgi:hypothetical protein